MAWLTGYDGWSFYVHQGVILTAEDGPFWRGREMDVTGARRTVHMPECRLLGYPDASVQSPERRPTDHLSDCLRGRGLGGRPASSIANEP
ncbi:MAG: hypothetical protein ACOCYE_02705 [Pseudomonadota bacterium]